MAIVVFCIILLCGATSCGEAEQSNTSDIDKPVNEEVDGELPSYDGSVTSKIFRTRLLCYNVRNCKGTDNIVDYKRVADVISTYKVEAVALQELDSMTSRYPGQDVLKNLADYTGMYPTFGAAVPSRGGKYGVGVLTKEKPLSHYRVPLPCSSEPRVMLVVELENYYFCSTHFSLLAEYRAEAARIIIEEAKKLNKPMIVAGDLNAVRGSEPIEMLSQHFHIFEKCGVANTFPSNNPTREIDFICLYKGRGAEAVVNEHWVPYVPIASDHRPIVADVTICE